MTATTPAAVAEAPPPVLQVSSVALPAAPARAPRGTGDALSALVVLLLVLGVLILSGAVIAGLALLTYVTRSVIVGIFALGIVSQIVRALALFVRPPTGEVEGVRLEPGEEPQLEAFVADLAARAGTKPPDEISLVADVNAMVTEVGPLLGLLPGTRRMAIGISLFDALDVSEMRAVLGHELGHFAGKHNRLTVLAAKVEATLAVVIVSVGPRSLVGRLFVGYWWLHRRAGAAVSRRQERAADLLAVRVAGRQAMADALHKLRVAARVEDVLRGGYLAPLLSEHELPWDVQYGFWSVASDPCSLRDCTEPGLPEEPHAWATHPTTEVRIARIGELADPEQVPRHDGRASRLLLRDANEQQERVRVAWAQVVVGDVPLKRVTWEQGMARANATWGADAAARADDLLQRMGFGAGLRGVYEAHAAGRGRELVSRLVADGWRTGADDEWRVVLRTVVMVTAARDAVAVGAASWAISWSGPVGLETADGTELPLRGWAEQALAGDWRPLVQGLTLDRNVPPRRSDGGGGGGGVGPVAILVDPPSPPFARGSGGWQWEVSLPGRLVGGRGRIRLADSGLAIDGHGIGFEQIDHVRIRVRRQGKGAVADLVLEVDGQPVKLHAAGASERDGLIIGMTFVYLWDLLAVRVAGRLAEEAMLRIAEGEEVAAGGLVLSRVGLARAGRRSGADVAPWAVVGDLRPKGRGAEVPRRGSTPLRADLDARDALLLHRLIPQARALLA